MKSRVLHQQRHHSSSPRSSCLAASLWSHCTFSRYLRQSGERQLGAEVSQLSCGWDCCRCSRRKQQSSHPIKLLELSQLPIWGCSCCISVSASSQFPGTDAATHPLWASKKFCLSLFWTLLLRWRRSFSARSWWTELVWAGYCWRELSHGWTGTLIVARTLLISSDLLLFYWCGANHLQTLGFEFVLRCMYCSKKVSFRHLFYVTIFLLQISYRGLLLDLWNVVSARMLAIEWDEVWDQAVSCADASFVWCPNLF